MNIVSKMKKSVYITAILSIVIGVLFLIKPIETTNFIAKAVGVVIIIAGLVSILTYIKEKNDGFISSGGLIIGVILFAVGLFLTIYSGVTLALLGFIIAVYIVIDGLVNLDSAIAMARVHAGGWVVHLILALFLIGAGLLMIFQPFKAIELSGTLIGIVLLVDGVIGFITALRVGRVKFEVLDDIVVDAKEI